MNAPTKILVPVDFSECARAALAYALVIGEKLGAQIQLLHVHEAPLEVGNLPVLVPGYPPRPLADYVSDLAREKMDTWIGDLGDSGVTGLVIAGKVEDEVVRYAADNDIDLIVVGTHGRSGFSRFMLGSIAEQIIRRADCPVTTVRVTEE